MKATYRGYTISLKSERVAYMTMYIFTIRDSRNRYIHSDDGDFDIEGAVRCAKRYIDRM